MVMITEDLIVWLCNYARRAYFNIYEFFFLIFLKEKKT